LYTGILSAFFLGLFFYQTVGGANIWEFFLAGAPLLSLMVALNLALLLYRKPFVIRLLILTAVVIFVIPQWLLSIEGYIHDEYFATFHGVSENQIASFDFINEKTPQNSIIFVANQPEYSYASVLNLFIQRDIYLSGNGVRQILTPELVKRRNEVATVSDSTNDVEIKSILQKEHVQYIYFYGKPKNGSSLKQANLRVIFANDVATIFQVQ
jgi:hypothetical protein